MAQLLVIALGPIQDFIASARRCQDLWFGSYLLSDLARATARSLAADALVFPDGESARLSRRERAEVANKVVAVVPGDAAAARRAAMAAEDAMRRALDQTLADVFASKRVPSEYFRREVAEAQVRELIEFVWVAVPCGDGDEAYRQARHEAERLLHARKNTRRWAQPAWGGTQGAGVPKSSLDGLRESVIHESLYPMPGQRDIPELAAKRRSCGVEGMERLCGVGLLKRLGRRFDGGPEGESARRRFASTSHLAALPWMLAIQANEAKHAEALKAYCDALDGIRPDILRAANTTPHEDAPMFGQVDGQVFFEGRLLETLEEVGLTERPRQEAARKALRAFCKAVEKPEPQGYYAILHADGDRMGKVIDHHGLAAHREISKALVAFAGSVFDVVRDHQGSLVYSGGDDVLALLPLHRALDCAAALAADFTARMNKFPDGKGSPSNLSAGLAIVHHLTPFDVALDVARRAETDAKATGGDALTILVDKRGGAEQRVSGRWGEIVPTLKLLAGLHRMGAVSAKTGHALAELARLTEGVVGGERETLGRVARATAFQYFDAKRARGGSVAVAEAVLKRLGEMLPETDPLAARTVGERLVCAQQLARVADEAGVAMPASLEEVLA